MAARKRDMMMAHGLKLFSYDGPALSGPGYEVYKHLATSEGCEDDRAYLEALWSRYSVTDLADPDFLDRFPNECPARIWEMRLACMFDDWKLSLVPSPKRGAGMDFGLVLDGGATCWVEATVPEPGSGPDRLEVQYDQIIHGATVSRATALRYLNAIASKREQYQRALNAGLVQRNDALIIAISGAQLRLADLETPGEPPLIAQIMFGRGNSAFSIEVGSGRVGRVPRTRFSFQKHSGSEVGATLFLSPDAAEVSAVLFDPHNVKNRPEVRRRKVGQDLVIVHNPFARVPVPIGKLPNGREFFMELGSIDHRGPLPTADGAPK